jgi:phosphopantothenoylcysteine decarboxylase / phosphopantothenate---cysteine ligase
MLGGKRILLIVGGGIAAYKSLELVRELRRAGASVRAVLTEAGKQFVTPLSLAALTESAVYEDLFSLKDETEMGHIRLSREADLIVVCPASANLLSKMATGAASDLASTVLLAADKPVLAVPAMNWRMWLNSATQRNVGEFGPGRLPAVPAIVAAIGDRLAPAARPLAGKRALVTAGPTHEPIDPVRYIANRSSGKQGFAIAEALARLGAEVTLVAGPVELPTPAGVRRIDVETARQMAAAVDDALPVDVAVMVAAVADWRSRTSEQKIKKTGAAPAFELIENPDILVKVASAGARRPRLVVGFAAETNDVVAQAKAKLARKGCDWIVANDVSGDVMGGSTNRVHLVTARGVEDWDRMPKAEVAARLAARIAEALTTSS